MNKPSYKAADETARTILLCPNEDDIINLSRAYLETQRTLEKLCGIVGLTPSAARHLSPGTHELTPQEREYARGIALRLSKKE